MGQLVDRRRVLRIRGAGTADASAQEQPDQLAVEAPLTLMVGDRTIATTMRTPGHDLELALGWLVAEGVARGAGDVLEATSCDADTVRLRLAPGVETPKARLGATTSACGICGSDTIAEVLARRGPALAAAAHDDAAVEVGVAAPDVRDVGHIGEAEARVGAGGRAGTGAGLVIAAELIAALPDRLRTAQRAFARSGGLHAAGLFTADGVLLCAREDVGRHNAVDKVIGWALQHDRLPAADLVLQVSGRASFELTQKAAMAGIPVLSAVSAPSTLAVDLAREAGLTLIGFVRGDSMNVYAGAERVAVRSVISSSQPG